MTVQTLCDAQTLQANLNQWRQANSNRLNVLYEYLEPAKARVIQAIPYLLHHKIGELEGEWFEEVCLGVSNFVPKEELYQSLYLKLGLKIEKKQKPLKLEIPFIAIMGSVASMGFNPQSDLDFWVGTHEKLAPEAEREFKRKLRAIEKWIWKEAHLEVHFFICPLEDLRNEVYGEADRESSGSAQGKLLKEEFYRTAVILEGCTPWYFLIPHGLGTKKYSEIVEGFKGEKGFSSSELIDIGGLWVEDLSEFRSAALWQLVKGMGEPFKAVLKLALLEYYLEGGRFLSDVVRENVQRTGFWPDPYELLIDRIIDFNNGLGHKSRGQFIARCFLIKSFRSKKVQGQMIKTIEDKLQLWNIERAWLEKASNFSLWSRDEIAGCQKEVLTFFSSEYRKISEMTELQSTQSLENSGEGSANETSGISLKDLKYLGEKLRVALGGQVGKIPNTFTLFSRREIQSLHLIQKDSTWELSYRLHGETKENPIFITSHSDPLLLIFMAVRKGWFHSTILFDWRQKLGLTKSEIDEMIAWWQNKESNRGLLVLNYLFPNEKFHLKTAFMIWQSREEDSWNYQEVSQNNDYRELFGVLLRSNVAREDWCIWGLDSHQNSRAKDLATKLDNQWKLIEAKMNS